LHHDLIPAPDEKVKEKMTVGSKFIWCPPAGLEPATTLL
jgi:hypothetical protein